MQRGSRSIFQNLFNDDVATDTIALPERKGRSEELVQKRNELLVCRHYYYTRIIELQYHRCLQKLEAEFFLSQRTIIDIINNQSRLLKSINAQKPQAKYFKEKYPFIVW